MASTLLLPSLLLIAGLIILVWSSDIFIDGAASVAKHLQVSPLIIGVVVLGFGTSTPEIIVSTLAALDGSPGLAIGNAVGSNIANIGLILGFTAILLPVIVKSSILKRELPLLFAVSAGAYLLVIIDGKLSLIDGVIMLVGLILVLFWMIKANKEIDPQDPMAQEALQEMEAMPLLSKPKAWLYTLGGLVILMISARMMVSGAVDIAEFFGVPEVVIGLTIIAIGTSLPELAAAIAAARKNEADLVIGNIVGSNVFNILAVLAVPAILAPSVLDTQVLYIDFPVMLGFTAAMLLLALPFRGKASITRLRGALLLAAFIAYLFSLYLRSTGAL
ncbi:MAG: calcium/sodium antiporter [Thiotrichales bacterium]|nr:calcium/sodium antiporter [Thiotrichales bacterium]